MNQPRFSIVTIALNDLAGLNETAKSIEAQVFSDFEWIVVDGGSTDGTLEYLKHLDQSNCRWTSEPDKGLFDAMNKGLNGATGDYVIFMNSGDRFAGGDVLARVDAQVSQDGRQPDLVFGDAYEESSTSELLLKPAQPARAIKRGMFTHHQAMFYARKAVGDVRYDCRFRIAGDYDFTCRLLAGGGSSLYVPFSICVFKRGGNSEYLAGLGRRENIAIQKEVLRLGPVRRAYNYVSFLAVAFLRTYMRGFYDRLRYRHASPTV